MRIGRKIAEIATATVVSALSVCAAPLPVSPSLDTTLNDFPPETAVGRYVQTISSNTVNEVVTLTNGVLTVNGDSVNIVSPTHTVVTTNAVTGEITTNVYPAVYRDDLDAYATIWKITSIVTNASTGVVQTNKTKIAYLDDIPPDSKKADKVIRIWDYKWAEENITLTRTLNKDAPFAAWEWTGIHSNSLTHYTHISLSYTNGVWTCITNQGPPMIARDYPEDAQTIIFGSNLSFSAITNDTPYAFVVYTDQMKKALDEELYGYVAKTNLYTISGKIEDQKLETIGGIQEILIGIRSALNEIAGGAGIHLRFGNVANSTLMLGNAVMKSPGDSVDIDWGDGSPKETTTLPATHTYDGSRSEVEVIINGFIKGISGTNNTPFACISNRLDSLIGFRADIFVGLEEIGDYAFYGCENITGDLTFLPRTVKSYGKHSFERSGISSLAGIPQTLDAIPEACFAYTRLRNLAGLSPGALAIGDYAFYGCDSLTSLAGIPQDLKSLGQFSFSNCGSLTIDNPPFNRIMNNIIPAGCFRQTAISSIAWLPSNITNIGYSAFQGCSLITSIEGIHWQSIGSNAFADISLCGTLTVPNVIAAIGTNAFYQMGQSISELTVTFEGRMLEDIMNLPEPGSNTKAFPWGLPLDANKTRIVCEDGIATGDGTGWVVSSRRVYFVLDNVMSNKVSLGNVTFPQTPRSIKTRNVSSHGYAVDWGDGMGIITNETSHTYLGTSPTNYTISIIGNIESISGDDNGNPFITMERKQGEEWIPIIPTISKVSIGNAAGLKSFGKNTFRGCTSLTNVAGAATGFTSLGEDCFAGCSSLTDICFVAESGITNLPKGCFRNCTSLMRLEGLKDSALMGIGDACFSNCTRLVSVNNLPNSLQTLGRNAFMSCTGIEAPEELILPPSIKVIPQGCFALCTNIIALSTGLNNVTSIESRAFAECSKLGRISISKPLVIADNAFENAGRSLPPVIDSDGFQYKIIVDFSNDTYTVAADVLGMEDGGIRTRTGLENEQTKVVCKNGDLLFNHSSSSQSDYTWEVVVPALEIELSGVTNGTVLTIQPTYTEVYDDAALVWNWGDGTYTHWINSPGSHTYNISPEQGSNFVLKIKGLLKNIASESINSGPYIRPPTPANAVGVDNPFIVGFSIPDNSPIRAIGKYSFSRCPNLRNINTKNLPQPRMVKPLLKKKAPQSRLQRLSAGIGSLPVEFGEGCFAYSGIETIAGLPKDTTSLTNLLFYHDAKLTTLSGMPQSIVDIWDQVFEGTGLQTLNGYPANVGYVSTRCFADCFNLEDISALGRTKITSIEDYSFYNCTNLNYLYGLPSSLLSIGEGSFMSSGLMSLDYMSPNVLAMGPLSFALCGNLLDISGISQKISALEEQTFISCTNLPEAKVPGAVTNIGTLCFADCTALTNILVKPNGTIRFGEIPFIRTGNEVKPTPDLDGNIISCTIEFPRHKCADIRYVFGASNLVATLPNTKFVGKDGYIICDGATWVDKIDTIEFHLTISKANTTVIRGNVIPKENYKYYIDWGDGNGLEEQFPTSVVKHVYKQAKDYVMIVKGKLDYLGSSVDFTSTANTKGFLRLGVSDDAYPTRLKVNKIVFGNNVDLLTIGRSAFHGYDKITDFSSMTNLKTTVIGQDSFNYCLGLKNLDYFPTTIEKISKQAFANCKNLKSISALMYSSLLELEDSAFIGCTSLTSILGLTPKVNTIPSKCFQGCTSLQSLYGIPEQMQNISDNAFYGCTSLNNISNLNYTSVTSLGYQAFANCSKLKTLAGFPYTLKKLSPSCFMGCSSLTNLDVESMASISEVGSNCFASCKGLLSIGGFPCPSQNIGEGMFHHCSSLPDILGISGFATNVAKSAFAYCTGFKAFTVPSSIVTFDASSLGYCYQLTNLVFSDTQLPDMAANTLVRIGYEAPSWYDQGDLINTTIRCPFIDSTNLMTSLNFPWGVPGATTKFVCSDAYVLYNGKRWVKFLPALEIEMDVRIGETYELGQLDILQGDYNTKTAKVDWGDGGFTAKIAPNSANGSIRHSYSTSGRIKVVIYGDVVSFSSNVSKPFLRKVVGGTAQATNPSIVSASLPTTSRITTIGMNAFYGCKSLQSVSNSSTTLRTFGKQAFAGCTMLSTLSCIDEVVEFGDTTFTGCSALKYSALPMNTIVTIGRACFDSCNGFGLNGDSPIVWPTQFTNVPQYVFSWCKNISVLRIPSQCKGISVGALDHIGISAPEVDDEYGRRFRCFVYMTHVEGNSLLNGGFGTNFPFGATETTKFICKDGYVSNDNGVWTFHQYQLSFFLSGINTGDTINVGKINCSTHSSFLYFGDGGGRLKVTNDTISAYVYMGGDGSTIVSLSGGVKSIKGYSEVVGNNTNFYPVIYITRGGGKYTSIMTSVAIEEKSGLEEVGFACFYQCSNLSNVSINCSSLTKIGDHAFQRCYSLKELDFRNSGIAEIGNQAFNYCSRMEDIYLKPIKAVNKLGDHAFANMGANVTNRVNEYGRAYTTNIHLEQFTGEDIKNRDNGPQDKWLLSDRSNAIITTYDGYYGYDDSKHKWRPYEYAIVIEYDNWKARSGSGYSQTRLGNIFLYEDSRLLINWGDSDKWEDVTESTAYLSHRYKSASGTYRIGLKGRIFRISGSESYPETRTNAYAIGGVVTDDISRYVMHGGKNNQPYMINGMFFTSYEDYEKYMNVGYGRVPKYKVDSQIIKIPTPRPRPAYSARDHWVLSDKDYVKYLEDLAHDGIQKAFDKWFPKRINRGGKSKREIITEIQTITIPNIAWVSCYDGDLQYSLPSPGVLRVKIGAEVGLREIGEYTFLSNVNLEEVVGEGVSITNIGRYAFSECISITNYPSPSAVLEIGEYGFNLCQKLPSVGNLSNCRILGEGAFNECSSLVNLQGLGGNSTIIVGESCFSGCSNLTSVSGYPANGNRKIPAYCFDGCSKLTTISGLPTTITNIGAFAFHDTGITDISRLSELSSLKNINEKAFLGAKIMNPTIMIPSSTTFLGEELFGVANTNTSIVFRPTDSFQWNAYSFADRNAEDYGYGVECPAFLLAGNIAEHKWGWGGDYYKEVVTRYFPCARVIIGYDTLIIPEDDKWPVSFTFQKYRTPIPGGVSIRLEGVSQNTSGVNCGWFKSKEYKFFIDWGDGQFAFFDCGKTSDTVFNEREYHVGTGHTYSRAGNYTINIGGYISDIACTNPATPLVRGGGIESKVTSVAIHNLDHINHRGGLNGQVFRNLINCKEIRIGTNPAGTERRAGVVLNMVWHQDLFQHVGQNVPLRTIANPEVWPAEVRNIKFRTLVDIEPAKLSSLYETVSNSIAPTPDILFKCLEGFVVYKSGKWEKVLREGFFLVVRSDYPENTSIGPFSLVKQSVTVRAAYDVTNTEYVTGITGYTTVMTGNVTPLPTPSRIAEAVPASRGAAITPRDPNVYLAYYRWGPGSSTISPRRVPVYGTQAITTITRVPEKLIIAEEGAGSSGLYTLLIGNSTYQISSGSKFKLDKKDGVRQGNGGYKWEITVLGNFNRIDRFTDNGYVYDIVFFAQPHLEQITTWDRVMPSPESTTVNFPRNITTLGERCFVNNGSITTLDWLPTTLKYIPKGCFAGCKSLKNISRLSACTNLRAIDEEAFANCISLEGNVSIPASVGYVGKNAFLNLMINSGKYVPDNINFPPVYPFKNYSSDVLKPTLKIKFLGKTNTDDIKKMLGFPWTSQGDLDGLTVRNATLYFISGGDYIKYTASIVYPESLRIGRMMFEDVNGKLLYIRARGIKGWPPTWVTK